MKKVFLSIFTVSLILILMFGFGTGCAPEEEEVAPPDEADEVEEPEPDEEVDEEIEFPTDTVEIVVGLPTGATIDTMGRGMAPHLSEMWDEAVIVENLEGANQATAYHHVADADPDGHTLYMCVMQTLGQHNYRGTIDVPLQEMEWIGTSIYEPYAIFVGEDSPYETIHDLLEEDHLVYGDTGHESALHPFIVTLLDAFDIDFDFIPGYSGGDLHSATLTGEIDFMARGPAYHHRTGLEDDFRCLLVASDEPHDAQPDVPTLTEIAEEYDKPELEPDPLFDLAFPIATTPGTPPEIVEKIADSIEYLYTEHEEFQEWLQEQGVHYDADPDMIGHEVTEELVAEYVQSYEEIGLEELEERLD